MFKIDRRLLNNFDWITFSVVVLLSFVGVMTIFSATRQPLQSSYSPLVFKQLIWLAVGLIGLIVFMSFDYIWLSRTAVPVYVTGIVLLVIVLVAGKSGMGAQRWLRLGPVVFQPSEFFKLIFIIMVAHYYSLVRAPVNTRGLLSAGGLILILPFLLLVKQPDLGTAMLIVMIFIAMSLAKGLRRSILVTIVALAIVSLPFLGNIMWTGLKDYQKNRLVAFMDPAVDPAGIGYHINQSKVAVGSGRFFGKGFLKGTQGPFRFLPERHTDFIFAVFAEEWGFAGSFVLISLYFLLIMRGIDTALKAKDEFGRMLAAGVTFMFGIYFFVNIGMTLGMMPVVGIPLPFMSYGGTALLSNFIAAGVLMNVRARRFSLFY